MAVYDERWNPALNLKHPVAKIEGDRYRALVTPWDACIQDQNAGPGQCITPPRDGGDYDYAHSGGTKALIPMGMDHAGHDLPLSVAAGLYANTDLAVVAGTYSEDKYGIWFDGEILPGVSQRQRAILAAGGLSGDWRWVQEEKRYRMIASQAVNTLGFRQSKAGARKFAMVASASTTNGHAKCLRSMPVSMPLEYSPEDARKAITAALEAMTAAAHEPEHTGSIMVALVPDDGTYSEIDDPHVTLVYGGKMGDENQPLIEDIHRAARALSSAYPPFTAQRSGAGELGTEGAHIMLLEHEFFAEMANYLVEFKRSEHAGFIAHTTVRYADPDDELPRARDLPETISFSNIMVAVGDDHILHPLVGPAESATASIAAALVASLT